MSLNVSGWDVFGCYLAPTQRSVKTSDLHKDATRILFSGEVLLKNVFLHRKRFKYKQSNHH